MRKTETSGWMVPGSPRALRRALRLAVIALGIGVVMTAGAVRAQDDEEDEKTFEEKIIEGIMAGIGGTNMHRRYQYGKPGHRLSRAVSAGGSSKNRSAAAGIRIGRGEGSELAERP